MDTKIKSSPAGIDEVKSTIDHTCSLVECEEKILKETPHIIICNLYRFHKKCWEAKKRYFKQKFGLI